MIKKVLIVFLIFSIFCAYFISSQEESVSEKGYACLENKVAEKCNSLSTEEKIFSLLAIDRCKTEVLADSKNDGECWPSPPCKIKTTAQAVLALNSVGADTSEAETWLLSKEIPPSNVQWLLQIDAESTSCSISYLGQSKLMVIDEDKTISGNLGTCLDVYNDYWVEIRPQCYGEEFEISCSKNFITSLLYKKENSDVIYVSKNTQSASAGGTTTEKVNSFCFSSGTSCDYEGTLWAARVLDLRGYDSSSYLPYLVTMTEDNSKFIPEAFLYSLTGSFKEDLLLKQKQEQFWYESGDKFYDTAVALYALQQESSQEKSNSESWLGEVQEDDGCWQNNVRNTAFILFSLWPKKIISPQETKPDCEDAGYFCLAETACQQSGGEILTNYGGCFGTKICCSTESLLKSCLLQGGEICSSNEECSGGIVAAADTDKCCVEGTCVEKEQEGEEKSECEVYGGKCKSYCSDDEEISSYDCPSNYTCCMKKASKGYTGIIILAILIVLVVLGIAFRKKLRALLLRVKSKFKGKSPPSAFVSPRGFPPGPSASIYQRTTPRRVLPPSQRAPVRRHAPQQPRGEIDEVLKKLKEMGK